MQTATHKLARAISLTMIAATFATLSMLVSSCSQPVGADAPPQNITEHRAVTGTQVAYTETVNNKSSEFASITFNLADQSQSFFGSAPLTNVTVPLSAAVVGVIVNGVNIPEYIATKVTMTDGKSVTVTWTDAVVALTDTAEMN